MCIATIDMPAAHNDSLTMRKRKRGYGSYVDEDTGTVTTVQTTKQAKRIHQKSGKWYKEPTTQELRIWDREAKQKAAAEKAVRREENKKNNATKRAEKEAKELELKQQMFRAGKITLTQTLAKKDEDQMNLHSWFGGRPRDLKSKKGDSLLKAAPVGDIDKDKPHKDNGSAHGDKHGSTGLQQVRRLSQESDGDLLEDRENFYEQESDTFYARNQEVMAEPINEDDRSDQVSTQDDNTDLSQSLEDFEIAEDSDAEPKYVNVEARQPEQKQDIVHEFKVPALPVQRPQRLPLSPMSKSDVNIRNSKIENVSSFKSKLAISSAAATANITAANIASTQAVKDLLSGLCTQDLDDDDLDEVCDKENEEPEAPLAVAEKSPTKTLKHYSPVPNIETIKSQPTVENVSKSSSSINDSFDDRDFDNIFAELGDAAADDFDDGGLDDATLLSLPATQLVMSAAKPTLLVSKPLPASMSALPYDLPNATYIQNQPPSNAPRKSSKKPLKPCDSFAIDGLSDDDLLEGLKDYERSQKLHTPEPAPATVGKKRTLPWNKPDWAAETSGGLSQSHSQFADHGDDAGICSQKTEILSSWD